MKLPQCFKQQMKSLLGDDYDNYQESLVKEPKRGFRINNNYISNEEFDRVFPYKYKSLDGLDNCCELISQEKIGNSIFHHLGLVYMQEPSSMLAVTALEVKEGDIVLDMCSAPGGKASQILDKNKTGIVVCNEIVRGRANILFSNIERQGFKNAVITSMAPEKLSQTFVNYFDKILVDAPCSGEGMFRKDPSTIDEWNEGLPEFNHQRQLDILAEADKMLKEGGSLVYSTCTFNTIEDEQTVIKFAKDYGYKIIQLPESVQKLTRRGIKSLEENTEFCGRCLPQDGFGEGQFVAKLIKKSPNENFIKNRKQNKTLLSRNVQNVVKELINKTIDIKDYELNQIGNNIYLIPNKDFPMVNEGFVSCGVTVGAIEKDRVVPHHQYFKAFGKEFKNRINLTYDDVRVEKYLHGEEIEVELAQGYAAVLVDNIPLGGGKVVGKMLKNYYPKGLRKS